MVWVPQQLVGSPLGASVTIECWLEAHPAALHYWARPDGQVLHDPTKYRIESINGATAAAAQQHLTNGTRSSTYTVSSNGFHDKKSKFTEYILYRTRRLFDTIALSRFISTEHAAIGDAPFSSSPINPSSYMTHLKLTIRHLTVKDYGP